MTTPNETHLRAAPEIDYLGLRVFCQMSLEDAEKDKDEEARIIYRDLYRAVCIAQNLGSINRARSFDLQAINRIVADQTKALSAQVAEASDAFVRQVRLNAEQVGIIDALRAHIAELERDKARFMQRIYDHDEGPCDHACIVCVKNANADDSMVIPGHVCTYHEVSAAMNHQGPK